jgi:Hemolysins and related proteins containing CBS domains
LDIISDGVKSGTIDEADKQIIENIFEFNDLKADEVMIPRTEMVAINIADDDQSNIDSIIKSGHTLVRFMKILWIILSVCFTQKML